MISIELNISVRCGDAVQWDSVSELGQFIPFILQSIFFQNRIDATIFCVGCMASDPQWQKEMITEYLQYILLNVNSRFRCISFLTLWNTFLLMQRYIHQIHTLLQGFSCLHKDIFLKTNVQVGFTNAIFIVLFHGMRNAWYIFLYFKYDTEKS